MTDDQTIRRTEAPATSRARRFVEATGFVGLWMAIGFVLRPNANVYLLIGIPLTVAFQLGVRRRRLEDLWVRDGRPIEIKWVIRVLTVAVVVVFALALQSRGALDVALWIGAAVVGAAGFVYAARHASRLTVRAAALCVATAGTIGIALMIVHALARHSHRLAVGTGVEYLLLYLAVSFVLEEVSFRGAIDSHVHHPAEPHGVISAVLVSAMWGLWHLPIVDGSVLQSIPALLAVHVPVGVGLSIFWRRSGNLAVPAFTHALIDAVRNAVA